MPSPYANWERRKQIRDQLLASLGVRYNENHDPKTGEFSSGDGGGEIVASGKTYQVTHSLGDDGQHIYTVTDHGKQVAYARLAISGKYAVDLEVAKDYRRKGIAAKLYDHIEQHLGYKLVPSPVWQTPDGKAFWDSRDKQKRARADAPADPGIYIGRPVTNEDEMQAWWGRVRREGDPDLDDHLHLTVVHSVRSFPWTCDTTPVSIDPAVMAYGVLGPDNAVVLHVRDDHLQDRFDTATAAGAVSDYPEYAPHVTLFYLGADADQATIDRWDKASNPRGFPGKIVLGPEVTGTLDENNGDVFARGARFNPNHDAKGEFATAPSSGDEPRDKGGKWTGGGDGTQTATAAFKKWFGDSKAVDKDGNPLVLYHGTSGQFDAFEVGHPGKNSNVFGSWDVQRAGVFFAEDQDLAREFADQHEHGHVEAFYLKAEDPIDLTDGFSDAQLAGLEDRGLNVRYYAGDTQPWEFFDYENGGKEFVAALKDMGYDSAIITDVAQGYVENTRTWVAFEPTQIKSATGNTGAFDPMDKSVVRSNPNHVPAFEPAPRSRFNPHHDAKGEFASGDGVATADMRRAVQSYVNTGYTRINGALRKGGPLSALTAKHVAALDAAIAKSKPLDHDTSVYRAVRLHALGLTDGTLVGATIRDLGYTSTSSEMLGSLIHVNHLDPENDRAVFKIDLPKGTRALDVNALTAQGVVGKDYVAKMETELILPRGSRFTVGPQDGWATSFNEKVPMYRVTLA